MLNEQQHSPPTQARQLIAASLSSSLNTLGSSFSNLIKQGRPLSIPRPASTTSLKDWQLPPQYQPVRLLGKGASGKVWLCVDVATGKQVALKLLRRPVAPALVDNLLREITLHTRLDHPHVVAMHAVHLTPTHVVLVLDAMLGGTLLAWMQARAAGRPRGALCMDEAEACHLFRHCHARGVAHRDVKLENMLLTEGEPPHACLCDFGFATTADALGMLGGDALHDGTPPYMAPQLLDPRNKAHSPAAADVWAAGVLLCAMLLGRFPYDHAARRGPSDAQLDIYCQQHLRHWSDLPELQAPLATLSPECRALLDAMLTVDEGRRATLEQALEHAWMQQALPERWAAMEHTVPAVPAMPERRRPIPPPPCLVKQLLEGAARVGSEWMDVDVRTEVAVAIEAHSGGVRVDMTVLL